MPEEFYEITYRMTVSALSPYEAEQIARELIDDEQAHPFIQSHGPLNGKEMNA